MRNHFNLFMFPLQSSKWTFLSIYSLIFFIVLFTFAGKSAMALTFLYSGEEQGQLGLHGCGVEQVGGLAHRQTLIEELYIKHEAVLNLHTGNLIDATDENAEWVYQIGLSALDMIKVDVLCLGPNELSLPKEVLATLHANHPKVNVVCANAAIGVGTRYLIQEVSEREDASLRLNVGIVGLVSESYGPGLGSVEVIRPERALADLKAELVAKSDIVVVVFHGTQEEARALSEAVPWVDVLIVAGDRQADLVETHSSSTLPGETLVVSNVSHGDAVGVLEVEHNKDLGAYTFTNRYLSVSEKIAPNRDIAGLIEVYEASTATAETFDKNDLEVPVDAVHLTYFHKDGCQKCARVVKILTSLRAKYPQIVVERRDAKTEQTRLEAMGMLYEVPETKRLLTPAVFIGDTALIGELDAQRFETTIEKYLATGVGSRLMEAEKQLSTAESEIVNRFQGFGILAVAGAGLLDGINPCAFATIVFFISYMNLVGRGRKEMLIAGGAFTLSVFGTYLLVGLGMLSFMSTLNRFSGVAKCVYLVAAAATFALAGLSLYDAVKAKQGKTKDIVLQLPRALKLRIHKVIREQTRTSGVIVGALTIGFTISALELVCTGQVYLPTLTFVASIEGMRPYASAYLLLYNLMFIVPLIVVFGCVYWGTTSLQLGGVLQRHLVAVKIGIGLLLFGLGTWLLVSVMA